MLLPRAMTLVVHPLRGPSHGTRRNAILVALAIPLVIAQCAEEGARTREDTTRGTASEDHQSPIGRMEEAGDVTP